MRPLTLRRFCSTGLYPVLVVIVVIVALTVVLQSTVRKVTSPEILERQRLQCSYLNGFSSYVSDIEVTSTPAHLNLLEKEIWPISTPDSVLVDNQAKDDHDGFSRPLLLVKSSKQTLWKRMPMQLVSMLIPDWSDYFIYSDHADVIHAAGSAIPVIDSLQNVSEVVRLSDDFAIYRDHSLSDLIGSSFSGRDGWSLDRYKNLPMLFHAWEETKNDPYDWYIMIDDDTYVFKDNLMTTLNALNSSEMYYLGKATLGNDAVVFGHGGSGCVFSKALMSKAFSDTSYLRKWDKKTKELCCGDIIAATYLRDEFAITLDYDNSRQLFQPEQLSHTPFDGNNWCSLVGTLHHVGSQEMSQLAHYVQRKKLDHPAIYYKDLYLDMVLPLIQSPILHSKINSQTIKSLGITVWILTGWNNNARNHDYSWSLDYDFEPHYLKLNKRPYHSLDQCLLECIDKPDCTMLRFDPYTKLCGIGLQTFSLGQHMNGKNSYEELDDWYETRVMQMYPDGKRPHRPQDNQMISIWLPDRITEMRETLHCDPLSNK